MSEKTTLLIVDDEPNIRRVLQAAFDKAGYVAHTAEDAEAALNAIGEQQFSCVITDVTMPGRSGYELLREIKSTHPELPVVIMTAFGTIPQAVQAIRNGAFEYVTKPFDLDVLKRVVAAAVEGGQPVKQTSMSSLKKQGKSSSFIAESSAM